MNVAIMQPYFLPYLGYFQLIAAADVFIVYDNIKYTKKGWINRNRMLLNDEAVTFSLPLKNASDSLDVVQRELSPQFDAEKLLNQMKAAYRSAPYFHETLPLLEDIIGCSERNLFNFLLHSIETCCRHMAIATPVRRSSGIAIDHTLKSQEKVLAICQASGAKRYINAIGGIDLYQPGVFLEQGIELQFLKSRLPPYTQFSAPFVPGLSIIDVLMFNSPAAVQQLIHQEYDLVCACDVA